MTFTPSRRDVLRAAVTSALICAAQTTRAQSSWRPPGSLRIIVPFGAGGGADVLARMLSPGLAARFGPTLVENKIGATGSIGSDFVYNSPPDGSVLLLGVGDSQSMYPNLTKTKWDPAKLVPIIGISKVPFVLMGRSDLPANNLQELLALARKQNLSYGSAGVGSTAHILTASLEIAAKLDKMTHVPYPGAAPATQALLGKQVDLAFVVAQHAKQYRSLLKAYGSTTHTRLEVMKDVPTLTEQGIPVVGETWFGLLAPPQTPASITAEIARAVSEIKGTPEFRTRVEEFGMTPLDLNQTEFTKFYHNEYEHWGKVIRLANIKLE